AGAVAAGARVGGGEEALGAGYGLLVEGAVALADAAQGPAHGLFDEVAVVEGGAFDEGQHADEGAVGGGLVVASEASDEGEGGALDPELVAGRKLADFLPRVRRCVEEARGGLIAEVPRVEVGGPGIDLRSGDGLGIVDEAREEAGFVVAGRPQGERELVIGADALGELAEGGDGHAERVLDVDAVADHAGAVAFAAHPAELGEERRNALVGFVFALAATVLGRGGALGGYRAMGGDGALRDGPPRRGTAAPGLAGCEAALGLRRHGRPARSSSVSEGAPPLAGAPLGASFSPRPRSRPPVALG